MNSYITKSSYTTHGKGQVWRLMKDVSGETVPMYEVHMPGLNSDEWFNFYLFNTGFGTFWIIAHIPRLHEIADTIHEMFGFKVIDCEFAKYYPKIVSGLHHRYNFELLREEDQTYCIERFPDFDSNDDHEHWKVATIVNIGKPLTMDFLEKLTEHEKETIVYKAACLFWVCQDIECETKIKMSKDSKRVIEREWNQFSIQNNKIARALTIGLRILFG